jgi:hypothetical protein
MLYIWPVMETNSNFNESAERMVSVSDSVCVRVVTHWRHGRTIVGSEA